MSDAHDIQYFKVLNIFTLISSRVKEPHILLNKTDFRRNKKEFSGRSLLAGGLRVSRDPGPWQVEVISDQSLGICRI